MRSTAQTPLKPRLLSEQIVRQLQRAIISGEYAPGQRLVERDLAEQFGVSSIPVREALQELENRGLVSKRPNYGCTVVQLTDEEAGRIWDLRRVLEPKVIEWAGANLTPENTAELEAQMERLAAAAETNDTAEFFHQDLGLHRLLWRISGNTYAARALETALGSLFASGLTHRESLDLRAEVHKHRAIVEALVKGQPRRAAQALIDVAENFQNHIGKWSHHEAKGIPGTRTGAGRRRARQEKDRRSD